MSRKIQGLSGPIQGPKNLPKDYGGSVPGFLAERNRIVEEHLDYARDSALFKNRVLPTAYVLAMKACAASVERAVRKRHGVPMAKLELIDGDLVETPSPPATSPNPPE